LLQCTSKSPTYLARHISVHEQGNQ